MSSLSLSAAGAARQAIESKVPGLVEEQFASKLFDKDPTLWGPAAEEEAKIRLGWTEAATVSRPSWPRSCSCAMISHPRGSRDSYWRAWAVPPWRPRSSPAPRG